MNLMDHEIILLVKHYNRRLEALLNEDPKQAQGWDAHLASIGAVAARIQELATRS